MQPRLAVLVDAENMGAKHWPRIRARIETLGHPTICRVFGNFAEQQMSGWLRIAEDEALQPVMQFAGPNACDISITVAAMDLLHQGRIEGVCIVSSDGDFTPLVHRLRSAGLRVYGFGKDKSALSLQKACTRFTVLSELLKDMTAAAA